MSGKHYPLRWVKTVTEAGKFVEMEAREGGREYIITRNDDDTFSARVFQRVTGIGVGSEEVVTVRHNLKHRVSLEDCIEDCEAYERAVNPPLGIVDIARQRRSRVETVFHVMLERIGLDVMTRPPEHRQAFPDVTWIVRSDRNADNDWCFLTPEREQDLADLVTAEGGIKPTLSELRQALSLYRLYGLDYTSATGS